MNSLGSLAVIGLFFRLGIKYHHDKLFLKVNTYVTYCINIDSFRATTKFIFPRRFRVSSDVLHFLFLYNYLKRNCCSYSIILLFTMESIWFEIRNYVFVYGKRLYQKKKKASNNSDLKKHMCVHNSIFFFVADKIPSGALRLWHVFFVLFYYLSY